MTRKGLLATAATVWLLAAVPVVALMTLFSAGRIFSPLDLIRGLAAADPLVGYNLLAWATLLFPILLIWLATRRPPARNGQ